MVSISMVSFLSVVGIESENEKFFYELIGIGGIEQSSVCVVVHMIGEKAADMIKQDNP
jgi:hypothetical protein